MSRPALNPFSTALAVGVVSIGLLAAAVVGGWLGPDLGHGDLFCEALRDGLVNQPANTWSNLGFVIAGLSIGWQARTRPQLMDSTVTLFACVVVLLGPASAAMHATGTAWGKHLDLTSMFLLAAFTSSYAIKRLADLTAIRFYGLFAVLLFGSEIIYLTGPELPVVLHAGNAVFAVLILLTLISEVVLWSRTRSRGVGKAGIAAVGTLGLSFVIWNLDQGAWCVPDSLLQGHAIWHLGCALSAYLLFRLYVADDQATVAT